MRVPTGPSMSQATLLEGIVVVDATQVMAGPYCAMLLADMGAHVIKVEPPAGDSTRAMAGARDGESHAFNAVNRGKRGVVLDLRTADGRTVFRRLVRRADVVVENFRPGVMAKFGLDYATLAADQPGLVYASISGLRPDRAVGRPRRLRPGGPGRHRHHVGDRRARTAAGQGRPADHRSRRRAVRARRHPGRAAAPRSQRRGPVRGHVADGGRPGAVGVGGRRVLRRSRRARPARFGAPDERALPGVPLRRRLPDRRRRQPADLRKAGRRARAPRMGGRSPLRHRRRARAPSRGAGRRHRRGRPRPRPGRCGWNASTPRAFRAGRSSTTPRRSTRRRRRPGRCRSPWTIPRWAACAPSARR